VEALLGSHQSGEVLAALQVLPPELASQAFVDTAAQADAAQLAELRSRLGSFAETDRSNPREAYAYRKSQLAGNDPIALLEGETDEALRDDLVSKWTLRAVAQQPDAAAVDLLMGLPEEYHRQSVNELLGEGRQGGTLGMATFLQELDLRGFIPDLAGDTEIIETALGAGVRASSTGTFAKLLQDLSLIRRDSLRHALLQRMILEGSRVNTAELLEDLPGLPRGADLDALLSGPAAEAETGPATREDLLAAISDSLLAARIRSEVAEREGAER
jgi:hypothetical protein